MNRFKNLLNYSLNSIRRYKIRTLTILICLGIAAGLFSSVAFMTDGLTKQGALSLQSAPDLTLQGIFLGRQTLVNTSYINYAKGIAGVANAVPRVWGYGNVGNTLVVIVGLDLSNTSLRQKLFPLETGTILSLQINGNVVVGKALADLLGLKVGSQLTIRSESNVPQEFIVAGVFDGESSIYSADMILMNINDARAFFDVPTDKATDVMVYVSNVDVTTKVSLVNLVARGLSELPNCRVVTKDVLLKAQETTYGDRSGFFSVVWYIVLIAVAIVAFNQTVVVGHESKFEVGLLKSLGFSTSDIIQVRLIESLVLGALAGAIGLTFGIVYDVALGAPVFRDFMLGWATLYPGFQVPVLISAATVGFTFAVTIVPLLFSTVIPSWINATVDPDIAMRGARA
jgi:ABC-type lipoprotein release transport system permease subunit